MSRKKVFVLCFFIVVFTLLFNANNIAKKQSDVTGIEISTKLISVDVKEGSNVIVDVELSNTSDNSIYNVELLTEAPNEDYTQAYGNVVCKAAEELVAGDSLCLRSVYEVQDDAIESFEGYKVQHRNILLMIECLMFYIVYVIALLKFVLKSSKLNIVYLLLVILCSFGVSVLIKEINSSGRNDSIIHSYEDLVEVEIAGKKQYVKVWVNYTTDSLESIIDKDSNGTPDVAEREDFRRDTDGDGLPDFYELYMCGTNPLMVDSQSTGLGDINCDTDKDGLSNLEEYELNCNPLNKDTDYDGLNDSEELELGTKVLEWDTDGDGMSDGFEITQGYDPLVKEEKVVVNKELSSEAKDSRNSIKAMAEVKTTGDVAESLDISTYETLLVNDNMPGYIGSAFEFIMDDSFESATISFELDDYWFNKKDCEPCIYYFNEDTQLLEEIETHTEGNIVSANVEHFSVYVVLNRLEVSEWMYKDMFIQEIIPGFEGSNHGVDVAFIIDNSQSIEKIDSEGYLKELTSKFMHMLSKEHDNASLVMFTKKASVIRDFTSDFEELSKLVSNTARDSGFEENSGSDVTKGLEKGLDILSTRDTDNRKYMFLVTDGDVYWGDFDRNKFVHKLKEEKISLYCVDIGSYSKELLEYICKNTGGKYYVVGDVLDEEVAKEFGRIEEHIIHIDKDSNADGITDYDTEMIINGILTTGTGISLDLFKGYDLDLLRSGDEYSDIDEDGLLNGQEMSIEKINGVTYLKLNSHPFKEDTDEDGILDKDDEAPFTYGQKGGIIGELYLATHTNGVGHAWLVFHSYVNKDFSEHKAIRSGYLPIYYEDNIFYLPLQNLYPYSIQVNSFVSFGHAIGQISHYNWGEKLSYEELAYKIYEAYNHINDTYFEEIESDFTINTEFASITGGHFEHYKNSYAISQEITNKQLQALLNYIDKDYLYTILQYNCTTFAIEGWNSAMLNIKYKIPYVNYTDEQFDNIIVIPWYLKRYLGLLNVNKHFEEDMLSWSSSEVKPFFRMNANGTLVEE